MLTIAQVRKDLYISMCDPNHRLDDLFPEFVYALVTMVSPKLGVFRVRFLDGIQRVDRIFSLDDETIYQNKMSVISYENHPDEMAVWHLLRKIEESIRLKISTQEAILRSEAPERDKINAQQALGKVKSQLRQFRAGNKLFGRICNRKMSARK